MTQNSKLPSSQKAFKFPVWAQLVAGLAFIALIYLVASNSTYVSAWDEQDSNFYGDATQALRMFNLSPTAPTAIVFWEKDCEPCKTSIKALNSSPSSLRIYGIHLSDSGNEIKIRKAWLKTAPKRASLMIDRSQLLQTSFHVKMVPETFIILPKQKKIFSYLGDLNDGHKRMLEIIRSE